MSRSAKTERVSPTTLGIMRSDANDLPPIQQRELGRLAVSDEACNVGESRLNARNGLVRAGLAQFTRADDGSLVCRITRLGREAHRVLTGGQATLLRQRLNALRAQHAAHIAEAVRIAHQIEVTEMQLSRLKPMERT
jgi:hypothetical protein